MANSKGKVKVKVEAKKAVKPKMGKGTGGFITARVIAKVNKDRANG
jgi:hypothetical protein|nr:MAG TPA: hypothetical protein [Caudoviricetes sp.]DAY73248.1 MAG TPA: hypothetical protein [Caudoviricetes sp.]